jgi:hypothetical protein
MLYWNIDRPLSVRESAHSLDVVYFADGLNSTISVTRSNDLVSLRTNGKADASNHDIPRRSFCSVIWARWLIRGCAACWSSDSAAA